MNIINLTPHQIKLRDFAGVDSKIPPHGIQARVESKPSAQLGAVDLIPVYSYPEYGAVVGLPDPVPGTIYIVSLITLAACKGRRDVYAPGTGPNDGAIRENGQIVAATRLIAAPL